MGAPSMVVIAGPNGAGKTTSAPALLRDTLEVEDYVNADAIATGLSAFRSDSAAMLAGRIAMQRLHQLAQRKKSFAFESRLAGRSLATFAGQIRGAGYLFQVAWLWLPSADMAVARVRERVRGGGHAVPDEVVKRRYRRGLSNFLTLYRPMADRWRVYDASAESGPRFVALGTHLITRQEADATTWRRIQEHVHG